MSWIPLGETVDSFREKYGRFPRFIGQKRKKKNDRKKPKIEPGKKKSHRKQPKSQFDASLRRKKVLGRSRDRNASQSTNRSGVVGRGEKSLPRDACSELLKTIDRKGRENKVAI